MLEVYWQTYNSRRLIQLILSEPSFKPFFPGLNPTPQTDLTRLILARRISDNSSAMTNGFVVTWPRFALGGWCLDGSRSWDFIGVSSLRYTVKGFGLLL